MPEATATAETETTTADAANAGESTESTSTESTTTATETTTAEQTSTANAETAKDAAPESYDLKPGEDSPLGEADVAAVAALAKDLGLSQENAAKVLAHQDQVVRTAQEARDSFHKETFTQTRTQWVAEIKADAEFGGANLDKTVAAAKAVLERFDTDKSLRTALDGTGFGDHPALVRLFARVGAAMSEDGTQIKPSAESKPKTWAERMYPGQA
jgi:hypothetical protein